MKHEEKSKEEQLAFDPGKESTEKQGGIEKEVRHIHSVVQGVIEESRRKMLRLSTKSTSDEDKEEPVS